MGQSIGLREDRSSASRFDPFDCPTCFYADLFFTLRARIL
ncbi:hypothetical protein RISK_005881 [Rhodopirellula islandica]|uniref:Uncharacterized protein n=1 Tax=Rhodopirellula islandica TaxID=595434 RepID=A0A0J1B5F9_RHOIS|nr:hypothetical protein RISK_005881 [Rhodopirellula islandica]